MKRFITRAAVLILILTGIYSYGQSGNREVLPGEDSPVVTVYYFHFTRRCATCLAVEENARKALGALFPDEVKTGEYTFTSLNLDEAGTKEIADKLKVGGQTLLVVCGDKKADITGQAWMSAHDPEKMKKEVKSGIDKVLF